MHTWTSILPPLVTLVIAITTKRIIPSLILGLIAGSALTAHNLLLGFPIAAEYLANSLASPESAYVVIFLFMFGALTEFFKLSGGIKGFARIAERYVSSERGALLTVWGTSLFTFMDCCFHVIAAGTIAKPLIDKAEGSKDKLAMVINTTSSQLVVLIPIATTYVGYIIGILATGMKTAGITGSPYTLLIKSIPYNFYSIGMIVMAILITLFGLGYGKWKIGLGGTGGGGPHNEDEAHEQCEFEEKVSPRAVNLFLPAFLLVALIIFFFWWTGGGTSKTFLQAITHSQFERSILFATFITLVLTFIFYLLQRVPLAELDSHILIGGMELLPPITILILSWSLSSVTQDLGFVAFVKSSLIGRIPGNLIPAAIFLISVLVSYFIGSSWATWALVIPLGLTLGHNVGTELPLIVGAMLAGGSVGDNISPLGETPILTASITEVPILDHVQSMLPYGLIVVLTSAVLYGILS